MEKYASKNSLTIPMKTTIAMEEQRQSTRD